MRSRLYARLLSVCCAIVALGCGGGGGAAANVPPPATPLELPAVDVQAVSARDPGSTLPADWSRGAFMEIFVRSYQDSDGDGIGDLKGLISRLDYLRDLGVTGLWLMPITRSQDHDHGYAVVDYRNVESAYGSLADLDTLLAESHKRGIGVILDYVMNHSGSEHPLFVNARAARDNPWRNWYVWQDPAPAGWSVFGGNPWRNATTGTYYGAFSEQMPDFNLTRTDVQDWHASNLRFWLNRGVDGFRFDAVGVLVENGPGAWENQPESKSLMGRVQSVVLAYPGRIMVCEAPSDPLGYAAATACGNAFAFNLAGQLVQASDRTRIDARQAVLRHFASAPDGMATFLSNHDGFAGARLWTQLGGDVARYKLAAAMHLLLPGTPFVYYGEEIGMGAGLGLTGDSALRSPMAWTASNLGSQGFSTVTPYRALPVNVASNNVDSQRGDPASLLSHYQSVLSLRKARPSLRTGTMVQAFVDGTVMGWQRTLGAQKTLVLLNTDTAPATTRVGALGPSARLTPLLGSLGGASADASGVWMVTLPAQSVQVFDVTP